MKKKKLKLWKLFYDLGFDNIISEQIEKFTGDIKELPHLEPLKKWAKKKAKKFR